MVRPVTDAIALHTIVTRATASDGAETVTCVSNIFKYYVAYTMLAEQADERQKALDAARKSGG